MKIDVNGATKIWNPGVARSFARAKREHSQRSGAYTENGYSGKERHGSSNGGQQGKQQGRTGRKNRGEARGLERLHRKQRAKNQSKRGGPKEGKPEELKQWGQAGNRMKKESGLKKKTKRKMARLLKKKFTGSKWLGGGGEVGKAMWSGVNFWGLK